jgi:MFS family permease
MVVMSVMTHIMPYLTSVGLGRALSGLVASLIPVVSILGRLSFGLLGDRYGSKTFAVIAFGMMSAAGILLALNTNVSLWVLVLFVLLFGTGFGASVVLRVSLLREFFGSTRFGTILGVAETIAIMGSIAGPPLAGWVFDEYASYQYMWYAVAVLMFLALVLMKTMPGGKMGNTSGSLD